MATPIIKKNSVVAIKKEVTEGVYVAPAAGADFIQTTEALDVAIAKELLEREVLVSSIGSIQPRVGEDSVTGTLPVEFKGSGTEGVAPEYGPLVEAGLGAERNIATQTTTKTGNSASQLEIQDADIGKFNLYDVLVVLEAGAHHICYVTAIDTTAAAANIQIRPAAGGAFSDNVVISKNHMYLTANVGHPTISTSLYWGNEILQTGVGMRTSSLSLSNFTAGQLAGLEFSMEGLSFARSDASAGFTPAFDSALPPVIINACVFQDGTSLEVQNFSFTLTNTISFKRDTCNGKTGSRISDREVSGSFNPYMDDADISQFTKFNANTSYELFAYARNPSSVAGEVELGSVVGIVMPNCITTEMPTGDLDGLLTDDISFSANRGASGTTEELYIGYV